MKKILISLYLILACFFCRSQTYNPSLFTTSNLPYGSAQAFSTDARSYFYDATNFTYRPYANNSEVLSYLNLAKYRTGNFPIIINVGGILSGGLITGGVNSAWWFQNCTNDTCLVLMIPAAGACAGCLINTNNLSDVSNAASARINLGLQNMAQQTTAAGGDLSGFWPNPTVIQFNGLPPSYYLNYNNLINQPTIPAQFNPIAGTNVSLAGSYPNITFNANNNAAGATAGYGINSTLLAAGIVAIDSLNYRKQDTTYAINDSTLIIKINGSIDTVVVRGGVHGSGSGAGTVTAFSFTNANGISGSVANPTSTPNLTLTLGAITPTSVNALTLLALTNGFSITGGVTPAVLTVPSNATVSGTNTGDVTLTGQTYLTISGQQINAHPIDVSGTNITGVLKAASFPAISGDVVISAGTTVSTIQPNVVTYADIQTIPAGSLIGNPTLSLGNSKAVFAKYGLLFDADSLKVDTTLLKTIFTGGSIPPLSDTLFVVNTPTGGLGFPLTRVSNDTAYVTKLFCVGCTIDSTTHAGGLTITANGAVATLNNGLTLTGSNGQLGGTLVKNTTIDGVSSFGLTVTSNITGDVMTVNNSNSTGRALHVTAVNGTGIASEVQSGTAVFANSATNGQSLYALSAGNGNPIAAESDSGFSTFTIHPVNNNNVQSIIQLYRGSQGVGANGNGASIDYLDQNTASGLKIANKLISKYTSATNTSETSEFSIWGVNSGAAIAQLFTVSGNGALLFNTYGSGTHTGTAAFNLAVDASHNVIEVATSTSGQTALTSGIKAISITGVTTSSKAFVTLVSASGTTLTTSYQAVCTSNTVTLQANVAAGTINTSDGSTLNYFVVF